MEKEKKQYASCLIKVPIFNHLNEVEQESIVNKFIPFNSDE